MNRKTIHVLLAIVVGLLLLLFVTRGIDQDDAGLASGLLLPDFRASADNIERVQLIRAEADDGVTVYRKDGAWVVSERDDYPADVGKLRQVIIALADAELVEEKTSNPDLYEKLGVDDPAQGGDGAKLDVSGPDTSVSVILGDSALGDYRYARVAGNATSYLINKDPDVPQSAADWLLQEIVDIDASDVQRVTIAHADGETLAIEKSEQKQTDFDVRDIPEDRELSYATVANGIAGALKSLELQDVRASNDMPSTTTTTFETWDGVILSVNVVVDEDTEWLEFTAALKNEQTDNGEAAPAEVDADNADAALPDAGELLAGTPSPEDKVAEINGRVAGWQYQVADYKKNLLQRRWDDILKDPE